jgi:hypothetical protein
LELRCRTDFEEEYLIFISELCFDCTGRRNESEIVVEGIERVVEEIVLETVRRIIIQDEGLGQGQGIEVAVVIAVAIVVANEI